MGVFSWIDCRDGSQILVNDRRPVYLLIPKEFGGGHQTEPDYYGDGRFGHIDVYEAVAEWNRGMIPEIISLCQKKEWHSELYSLPLRRAMESYYKKGCLPTTEDGEEKVPLRDIGILMACHDEDNCKLQYPIKITHDPDAVYEDCGPSAGDPDQGFPAEADEEDDDSAFDAWQNNFLSEKLREHLGHHVEIAVYGDPDNPECVCLECTDCNEVILDGSIYTICGREDV